MVDLSAGIEGESQGTKTKKVSLLLTQMNSLNGLAQDKIKGLLHAAGISLIVVVMTATLLRIGLEPKNGARGNSETTKRLSQSYLLYQEIG